jgi:hypothetical protein
MAATSFPQKGEKGFHGWFEALSTDSSFGLLRILRTVKKNYQASNKKAERHYLSYDRKKNEKIKNVD